MKRKTLFLTAICFTLLSFSQSNSKIHENKDRTVYWFEMGIKYSEPDEDAHITFIISKTNDEIKTGTIKDFVKDVYEALKIHHICIGYYNTKLEAEEAKAIYDIMSDKGEEALKTLQYSDQGYKSFTGDVYWFILQPFEGKDQWHYVRRPGALASGSIEDFFLFLKNNLLNQVFATGPFISGETAEDSKRIFRLQNESLKKKKKHPFNFKGTWVSKPGTDTMTIDIKKGFKTKITCSFKTEGHEIERTVDSYNLIHPLIIYFSFDIFEVLPNYFYLTLFLSDDQKSIRVKMNDRNDVTKEYILIKQ